jgi:hypothetical protein
MSCKINIYIHIWIAWRQVGTPHAKSWGEVERPNLPTCRNTYACSLQQSVIGDSWIRSASVHSLGLNALYISLYKTTNIWDVMPRSFPWNLPTFTRNAVPSFSGLKSKLGKQSTRKEHIPRYLLCCYLRFDAEGVGSKLLLNVGRVPPQHIISLISFHGVWLKSEYLSR